MRFRRSSEPPLEAARAMCEQRVAHTARLDPSERQHLFELTAYMGIDKRFEAAQGFEITEDMRLLIAAHACVLILHLEYECYRNITSIIVHPTTIERRGPATTDIDGVFSDAPRWLLGEAHHRGPVLLAWDATAHQARHPRAGRNVVYHEFAHRLDMLDDVVDGTPPLLDVATRDRWIAVCRTEFESLVESTEPDVLDDYGAESLAEFFAVATEAFFTRPSALREGRPALYEILRDYYRQDPAAAGG